MLPQPDPLGPLLITDMIGKAKNQQVLLTLLAQGVKLKVMMSFSLLPSLTKMGLISRLFSEVSTRTLCNR